MIDDKKKFEAWWAKYGPVEEAIYSARERRLANKNRNKQAKRRAYGDLCEATEGLAKVWMRNGTSMEEMLEYADGDVWVLTCLAKVYGKAAVKGFHKINHAVRRPYYYEAENARRRKLAEERRKIRRRTTLNACPTREEVLDAWIHLKDSHAATIHFGSLINDLECYLDNSLLRDENGAIIGRRGGIKRWLQDEIPALYLRYTTVMRYKSLAIKLRQITETSDPMPADRIVSAKTTEGLSKEEEVKELRAKAIWLEVIDGIANNPTALIIRIEALSNPNQVNGGAILKKWRAKYKNEITVRRIYFWRKKIEKAVKKGIEILIS